MLDLILKTLSLTHEDAMMIPAGIAFFLFFWFLSSKAIFSPLQQLVEDREDSSLGVSDRAQELLSEASALTERVEKSISQALMAGMKEKVEALAESSREGDAIILKASREADLIVEQGRQELVAYAKKLQAAADANIASLAQEAAQRIISVAANPLP